MVGGNFQVIKKEGEKKGKKRGKSFSNFPFPLQLGELS
jgi:hypothetical protein